MRTYHVYAQCSLPHGVCPYCGCVSHRVHSRYHRTITDLSILGHPVVITFEARKLLSVIGVSISGDTVLRDIHRMSVPRPAGISRGWPIGSI